MSSSPVRFVRVFQLKPIFTDESAVKKKVVFLNFFFFSNKNDCTAVHAISNESEWRQTKFYTADLLRIV